MAKRSSAIATGSGTALAAMHSTAVLAAAPIIVRHFDAGAKTAGAMITTYLLTVTALLLVAGRIADVVGKRRVFIASIVLFVIASAAIAGVDDVRAMLILRVLQGAGAAGISATATALLGNSAQDRCRATPLGWQSALTYLGLVAGAPLALFLATRTTWRLIFLVNVPIGIAAIVMAFRILPRDDVRSSARAPFRIDRSVTRAAVSELVVYAALYVASFLLPLLLVRGGGATRAGLLLALTPLARALVAPAGGALADRIGSARTISIGCVACAAAFVALAATISPVALLLLGAGSGLFVPANAHALLARVPPQRNGTASGLLGTARNLGMAAGTTIAANFATSGSSAAFLIAAALLVPIVALQSEPLARRKPMTEPT